MSEIEIIKDHGDFKCGDIVKINNSIASILMKKGFCKIIKASKSNSLVEK